MDTNQGFFFNFVMIQWSDNHLQDDLARFGYRLDMKVEKNSESFYILGYLLELIIKISLFENFFLGDLAHLDHFFNGKSFV
jgi:hypothetical protein